MMFCAVSIAVSLVCVVTTFLLRKRWGDLKHFQQKGRQLSASKILNLLKTSKLFPVGVSKGWLLSSIHHGHRVWTKVVYTGSANQTLTLYAAYTKVAASSQVLLQLLRDVGRVGEWSPRVVSSCQSSPTVDDATGRRKPYPSLPVQHDEVTEVRQLHDHFLDHKTEEVFKRVWHREDNGCCWLLKRSEWTGRWVFYLAQPAEDVDHSLLTVISPENEAEDQELGVAALLGCLKDQLAYRKTPFTPLLSITVPPAHLLDNSKQCPSSTDEQTSNNNNSSQDNSEEDCVLNEYSTFTKTRSPQNEKPNKIVSNAKDSSKGGNRRDNVTSQHLTEEEQGSRMVSYSAPPKYVMRFEKTLSKDGDSSLSSTDEFSCSLSVANVTSTSSPVNQKPPIRRAESDSSLLKKRPTQNAPRDSEVARDASPKAEEGRRQTKLLVLANQAAAEILIQSFKASSVDVRKVITEEVSYKNCPGGWLFSGLENDVVVFRRLFKNGMSTQSYMGKGLIHASPKTVWDGIRNPRMKFTYDETLKKVDILESVSETIKIVYYYHEVLQLFRKESCDFCVLQSERVDGDKYVLSLQSVESEWAPKLPSTLRGKILPSGWIVQPVKTNKKVISMVTFLMQVDLGPGPNGSTLPFEDMVARQPMGIVQLREYFRPLVNLAERR